MLISMTDRFPWLNQPPLAPVLQALNADAEEARVVGGAVRNALLGEPVKDWDIATTAPPDVVTARCRASGWKVVPTGLDHGTVTVVLDGTAIEITTLREDLETDGRRAVVRFGRDFRADALRRDFTINALSLSLDGTLHDYAGGMDDLAHRRIRFIGDPDQRIAEDYLRILRLFRFHARYGKGPVDREALAASIRGRDGLARVSKERIHHEMFNLLMAAGADDVLKDMEGAGFLAEVLAGVAFTERFQRLAALELRCAALPRVLRRLAGLAVLTQEDAQRVADMLRLSNLQRQTLHLIAAAGEALHLLPTLETVRGLAYRWGKTNVLDALLIAWAQTDGADWQAMYAALQNWTVPALPWRGEDLVAGGIAPGPAVGKILKDAEKAWIAAGFPADPGARQAILAEAMVKGKSSAS